MYLIFMKFHKILKYLNLSIKTLHLYILVYFLCKLDAYY